VRVHQRVNLHWIHATTEEVHLSNAIICKVTGRNLATTRNTTAPDGSAHVGGAGGSFTHLLHSLVTSQSVMQAGVITIAESNSPPINK